MRYDEYTMVCVSEYTLVKISRQVQEKPLNSLSQEIKSDIFQSKQIR